MSLTAAQIARQVKAGECSATSIVEAALTHIASREEHNCFTTLLEASALANAATLDHKLAAGETVGLLAGVPFAVKNLFDIAGTVTLAGSKINQSHPPATQDATAVARLKAAGAILVGALNMDEYAYGFVTINHHYGVTPNPHDPSRMSGGSSGGSAASVAAGLVPLTLGSDTNGSIRVPASLCGVYGFKPTYSRLSRAGAYLFSSSLDHIGPFARSVEDIVLAFEVLQGPDSRDPICTDRPPIAPDLSGDMTGIRVAMATGRSKTIATEHFSQGMTATVAQALEKVSSALQVTQTVTLPESARARAAAYLITASEGSQLHLQRLQTRLQDFDPATRDRFVAGAMMPNSWYLQAQRFRRWYRDQVREIFKTVDLIIAPTTPCPAPLIDQTTMELDGQTVPIRPHLGYYTQPLSFIGLPVLSVPIFLPDQLPVGIQLIARPYDENTIFKAAVALEKLGVTEAKVASSIG
ncbi:AtzE family amidohydrolase [Acaryochloris sp. 'Moss Beach']|uniref:AtzE family amidohydrolase n=1 Tax=Acaryochloris sp. 'Moss Beach' TaxID=2740837 RepID=UPI001F3EEAC4|nr:AtzE family amidohydrolase [Acaryochloris sp. 'Moss Beach']UJB70952.1 AtzE family amidohydrolase [Acaryochloris sp. 'Moss Beach']